MFIKNYKNFLIDLNVINSNTFVKCIVKCSTVIIILIKSQSVISFKFCKKIDLFFKYNFLFKIQNFN